MTHRARDLKMDILEVIEKQIDRMEAKEGYSHFILAPFTVEQLEIIRQFIASFDVVDPDA